MSIYALKPQLRKQSVDRSRNSKRGTRVFSAAAAAAPLAAPEDSLNANGGQRRPPYVHPSAGGGGTFPPVVPLHSTPRVTPASHTGFLYFYSCPVPSAVNKRFQHSLSAPPQLVAFLLPQQLRTRGVASRALSLRAIAAVEKR